MNEKDVCASSKPTLRFIGDYRIMETPEQVRLIRTGKVFGFLLWFFIGLPVLGLLLHTLDWSKPDEWPSGAVFALIVCVFFGGIWPIYHWTRKQTIDFNATEFMLRTSVFFWTRKKPFRCPTAEILRFEAAREKVGPAHEGPVLFDVVLVVQGESRGVLNCSTAFDAETLAELLNTRLLSFR